MKNVDNSYIDIKVVLDELTRDVARFNSQARWATEHDISPAYLSDVLTGQRKPGKKILNALGLEAITVYRKKRTN